MPDNELANSFMKECIKGEQLKHQELLALYYEIKESRKFICTEHIGVGRTSR